MTKACRIPADGRASASRRVRHGVGTDVDDAVEVEQGDVVGHGRATRARGSRAVIRRSPGSGRLASDAGAAAGGAQRLLVVRQLGAQRDGEREMVQRGVEVTGTRRTRVRDRTARSGRPGPRRRSSRSSRRTRRNRWRVELRTGERLAHAACVPARPRPPRAAARQHAVGSPPRASARAHAVPVVDLAGGSPSGDGVAVGRRGPGISRHDAPHLGRSSSWHGAGRHRDTALAGAAAGSLRAGSAGHAPCAHDWTSHRLSTAGPARQNRRRRLPCTSITSPAPQRRSQRRRTAVDTAQSSVSTGGSRRPSVAAARTGGSVDHDAERDDLVAAGQGPRSRARRRAGRRAPRRCGTRS